MKLIGSLSLLMAAVVPLIAQSGGWPIQRSAEMSPAQARIQSRVLASYGRLPLAFEAEYRHRHADDSTDQFLRHEFE